MYKEEQLFSCFLEVKALINTCRRRIFEWELSLDSSIRQKAKCLLIKSNNFLNELLFRSKYDRIINASVSKNVKMTVVVISCWFFTTCKNSYFHSFLTFSDVKKLHSETRKRVIGKKLLGSNRAYMS